MPSVAGSGKNTDNVRLVTPEEEEKMSANFKRLANLMQVSINGVQRQIFTNVATLSIHDKKVSDLGLSNLFNGMSPRLFYPFLVTYPSLQVRKIMRDAEAPHYAVNFATGFSDAALGVPLEVTSLMKTLKLVGVNISARDLAVVSTKSFLPFMVRNQISWAAINDPSVDLQDRMVNSASSAVISTPFNNIGIKIVESSVNKTMRETIEVVVNQIKKNPAILAKGMPTRIVSVGIMSSFLLSPHSEEYIEKKCQEIFANKPSVSPKSHNAEPFASKNVAGRDGGAGHEK